MQARLRKRSDGNSVVSTVLLPARAEHTNTVNGADCVAMHQAIDTAAAALDARVLTRFVFANDDRSSLQERAAGADGATVWLLGDTGPDCGVTSMQAVAVSGTPLVPVTHLGRCAGFVYEDEQARYCRLSGILPRDPGAPRDVQTHDVLECLAATLAGQGFEFTDTVRTWFYLDRLLEWYPTFNTVRTAFFARHGVFEKRVPASTGIGAGNLAGAALSADLLAVQPKNGAVRIQAVPSPLQGSALNYRSSFSRAVELGFTTHRCLTISGTASIGQDGQTVFLGDSAGQIGRTLEVVQALLQSRGMEWSDVSRGIAYFTDLADRSFFEAACRERGLPTLPLAMAQTAICRADLLFELEVDAVCCGG